MSATVDRELNEAQDNVPVEFTIQEIDDTESGANENEVEDEDELQEEEVE